MIRFWRQFLSTFKKKPNLNLPYCGYDSGYGFVVTQDELLLSRIRLAALERKGTCTVAVLQGYEQKWFVVCVQCLEATELFRKHGFPAPSSAMAKYYEPRTHEELLADNLRRL